MRPLEEYAAGKLEQETGRKRFNTQKVKRKYLDVSHLGRSSQFWEKLKDAKKC